jgi:hypothetical protein
MGCSNPTNTASTAKLGGGAGALKPTETVPTKAMAQIDHIEARKKSANLVRAPNRIPGPPASDLDADALLKPTFFMVLTKNEFCPNLRPFETRGIRSKWLQAICKTEKIARLTWGQRITPSRRNANITECPK